MANPEEPAAEPAVDVDEDDSVDLILRHISHRFPAEVVRGILGADAASDVTATVVETQVASRQRKLDRTIDARINGERRLYHLEWQSKMPADMPFRTYEYQSLMGFSLAAENPNGSQLAPPIESIVVLLGGRKEPWPQYGSYRVSPPDAPFSGVHFRIVPVYQMSIAELVALRSTFWLIFAPLAVDADESSITHLVRELRPRVAEDEFQELGVAMAVMAESDQRSRGLGSVVRSLLPEELVMQSSIYKEGLEKGLEQGHERGRDEGLLMGLRPLVRQFERRLARLLTPEERTRLAERVREQGSERIGDIVLDLPSEELAAWLAPTNGH